MVNNHRIVIKVICSIIKSNEINTHLDSSRLDSSRLDSRPHTRRKINSIMIFNSQVTTVFFPTVVLLLLQYSAEFVVLGQQPGAYSFVGGQGGDPSTNAAYGDYAFVGAGEYNSAEGSSASVVAGHNNTASGSASSVMSGDKNMASGTYSSVMGGADNMASGTASSVVAGINNTASGSASSVMGGAENTASSRYSSVMGGAENMAYGTYSSVVAGSYNTASGRASSVVAGNKNIASGIASSVMGGRFNNAEGDASSVVAGNYNTASGFYSSVMGGYENTASGEYSIAMGGYGNTASGVASIVMGSNAIASNDRSLVINLAEEEEGQSSESTNDGQFLVKSDVFTIQIGSEKATINQDNIGKLQALLAVPSGGECEDEANYLYEGKPTKDCLTWAPKGKNCRKRDTSTGKTVKFYCPSVCKDKCTLPTKSPTGGQNRNLHYVVVENEQQASIEELQASNEKLQAINEELRDKINKQQQQIDEIHRMLN